MPFAQFEPVHDFASVGAALIGLEPIPGVRLRAADITEAAIQLERGMSGEVVAEGVRCRRAQTAVDHVNRRVVISPMEYPATSMAATLRCR